MTRYRRRVGTARPRGAERSAPAKYATGVIAAALCLSATLAARSGAPQDRAGDDVDAWYQARRYVEARDAACVRAISGDRRMTLLCAQTELALNQVERALPRLESLVRQHANDADTQLWVARAYAAKAQTVNPFSGARLAIRAKQAWERALALDPHHVEARSDLVGFYLTAPGIIGGSVTQAKAHAEALRRDDPYRGGLEVARIERHLKRADSAQVEYRALIARRPARPEAHAQLIAVLVTGRAWREAFAEAEAWRGVAPSEVEVDYWVGHIAAVSGERLDDGQAALARYLGSPERRGRPTHATAHVRRAQIAEHRGDLATSRAELDAALRLEPEHREAASRRRGLPR